LITPTYGTAPVSALLYKQKPIGVAFSADPLYSWFNNGMRGTLNTPFI